MPIGLGYGINGRTSVYGTGMPPEHGGDISIGVKADFRRVWQASVSYTHYLGEGEGILTPENILSYNQVHKDRNFVSFSVQYAF